MADNPAIHLPRSIGDVPGLTAQVDLRKQRDRRDSSLMWDYAAEGFTPAEVSGATDASGYIAASVGGTMGFAYIPWWNHRILRASFRVKCTKGTVGSISAVGVANCVPSAVPDVGGTGTYTFQVGYVQGTGITVYRNRQSVTTTALADASITDGAEYDIAVVIDRLISPTGYLASGYANTILHYRVTDTNGAYVGNGAVNITTQYYDNCKTLIVSTNVAAGGITNLKVAQSLIVPTGGQHAEFLPLTSTTLLNERAIIIAPAGTSNGRVVVNMHGHTSNEQLGAFTATYEALLDAGYTIVSPYMGGNLWGNPAAQGYAAEIVEKVVEECGLDKRVFLYGMSMGGGAALTAIALDTFGSGNVAAAYLTESACDLSALWANASFTTLPAAYNNDTALRDASSPIAQAASAYAGVPLLFVASAADTSISKTTHTDAMIAHIGLATYTQLIVATGNHGDASHFRAKDTVRFFDAYL